MRGMESEDRSTSSGGTHRRRACWWSRSSRKSRRSRGPFGSSTRRLGWPSPSPGSASRGGRTTSESCSSSRMERPIVAGSPCTARSSMRPCQHEDLVCGRGYAIQRDPSEASGSWRYRADAMAQTAVRHQTGSDVSRRATTTGGERRAMIHRVPATSVISERSAWPRCLRRSGPVHLERGIDDSNADKVVPTSGPRRLAGRSPPTTDVTDI